VKRPIALTAAVLSLGATAVPLAATHAPTPRTYMVTVENLTPAGSQPLSPPLIVVHGDRADVWSVGDIASHPVAAIAEDANNAPAVNVLSSLRGVRSATTGIDTGATAPAPIGPGAKQTYAVRAHAGQRLSIVSMLVNTNDGFTGLDGLRLRHRGTTVYANAYDGGSEVNNQLAATIPGPVGNAPFVRDPEGDVIRAHPGIQAGVGDLDPAVHGWTGPVAKITIAPAR
jgi:hypothetical protein